MKPRTRPNHSRALEPWLGQPWKIAGLYAIVSAIWIIASDTAVHWWVHDEKTANLIHTTKGWAFVIITAGVLWWLVRRLLVRICKSEEEFRRLSQAVEQSPVSIIITDTAGDIQYVNPATCRLTRYTAKELIGKNPSILRPDHVPPEKYKHMWDTILQGREWHGEFRNRKKNGELYWEMASISPITDAAGKITHFLAIKEDITERKRAEEELKHHETLLKETGEIAKVGGWEFDTTSRLGSHSEVVARILGVDPELKMSEAASLEFFQGASRQALAQARAAAFAHGTPYDLELEMISADGHKKWIRSICRPVMENGRVTRLRGTLQDITDRKNAEEKLELQETLLEETSEIAMVGGWQFDPVTRIGNHSAQVSRIFDIDPGQDVSLEESLDFFPGDARQLLATSIANAIEHGTPYDLETQFISAKGRMKWVRSIGLPIIRDGKVIRVRGTIQDITERKRADQELQQSRAQLRALLARLQKAREDERTRISREVHDVLGQLLTGIKLDLAWCGRRMPRIDNEELRGEFSGKLTEITSLTDSMLDSVQKISRDLRPSLLDNLGLIAALKSEARQFTQRTAIPCEITSIPDSVELSPDATTQVFRIFQEILTNVARHSDASQVSVALLHQRDGLTLSVEDNGCGISPGAQQNADSLGLLGMAERASLVSGRIEFLGSPGGGTKVHLTVPQLSSKTPGT